MDPCQSSVPASVVSYMDHISTQISENVKKELAELKSQFQKYMESSINNRGKRKAGK